MRIGDYELHAIETGRFGLDGGAMFGVVPKALWEKTNPPDEKNRIELAARALLLVGGGKKILIDVGNGSKYDEKLRSIFKIDSSQYDLISSLKKFNLSPPDITDVILTHLHFDHAGGSTYREGGQVKPTFPKAKYYVQREHWRAATNPTERDRASFMSEDFMPLQFHNVLEYTEGEGEILPGVSVRLVHGHTTALQCPLITDGTTTVFYCADLIPTTSHLALPWIMAYDLMPLVTLEEKKTILNQAVDESWIIFFEHDPQVEAARVIRTEKGIVVDTKIKVV
ncbi:MAG: MBL fold metallo-hydrolase [Ignavibacteria bacterium]|nr:MBL fold metallo-hydrolase [Ignavibacteria bacterium]